MRSDNARPPGTLTTEQAAAARDVTRRIAFALPCMQKKTPDQAGVFFTVVQLGSGAAGLAMIGTIARGLGGRFAHVLALLGLAVELAARAMVDLAVGVDPDLARARDGGRSLGRRGGLRRRCRCRCSRRSRSRRAGLGSRRGRCGGRRGSRCRRFCRRCGRRGGSRRRCRGASQIGRAHV